MKRIIAAILMTLITVLPIVLGVGQHAPVANDKNGNSTEYVKKEAFVEPGDYAGTVTVKINPEICLYFDSSQYVVAVNYLNNDAKDAYSELELIGLHIDDALELIVVTANEKGYIHGDSEIEISFSNENMADEDLTDTELRIQQLLEEAMEQYEITGILIMPYGEIRSMRTDKLQKGANLIGKNIKDVPFYDHNGLPIIAEPVFVQQYNDDYSHAGIILTQTMEGEQIKVTYDRGDVVFPADKLEKYKQMGFSYFAPVYETTTNYYERIWISTPYTDFPIPSGYVVDTGPFDSGATDLINLPAGSPAPSNVTVVSSEDAGNEIFYSVVRYYIYATKTSPATEKEREASPNTVYDGLSSITWNDGFVDEQVVGDKIVEYSAQFVY